jgi:hypothetical protein
MAKQEQSAAVKLVKSTDPARWINGMMVCKASGCGAKLMVRGTNKIDMGNGTYIIERAVKCQGPCRHSYTHVEKVQLCKK